MSIIELYIDHSTTHNPPNVLTLEKFRGPDKYHCASPDNCWCFRTSYSGARTADAFLAFLKKKLAEDKGFGRVEELDVLAKKAANLDALHGVMQEMEAAVGKLVGDEAENGRLYLTVLKKALEKVILRIVIYIGNNSGSVSKVFVAYPEGFLTTRVSYTWCCGSWLHFVAAESVYSTWPHPMVSIFESELADVNGTGEHPIFPKGA